MKKVQKVVICHAGDTSGLPQYGYQPAKGTLNMDKTPTGGIMGEYEYHTDYMAEPGTIIEQYMEDFSITLEKMSSLMGITKKSTNEMIKGDVLINYGLAKKLEGIFGRGAYHWMNDGNKKSH